MQKTKKTAAKKATKKTVEEKLPEMTQINGKDENLARNIQVSQKKSLDEIWGRKHSKFKTTDEAEYAERLKKMTKLDLQHECIRIGLMPHDKRDTMIERLNRECRKYLTACRTSNMQPQAIKLSDAGREVISKSGNSLI